MEHNWRTDVLMCFAGLSANNRANWGATRAFLHLYRNTRPEDRESLIVAVGQIMETSEDARIIASLIQLAYALNLASLDRAITALVASDKFTRESEVCMLAANYRAMRDMYCS